MKAKMRQIATVLAATIILATAAPVWAATNQATDPGGGGVTLASSGLVTVNTLSSPLQLVKQVYSSGNVCLASQPADATCNSSATSVTVPSGTALKFLIFVKNTSDVALTDVRIQDVLDTTSTGFTYIAGSIIRTSNDATTATLADSVTSDVIYLGIVQPVLPIVAVAQADTGEPASTTHFASYNSTTSTLTVGNITINGQLNIPAHKSFGIVFSVTKK